MGQVSTVSTTSRLDCYPDCGRIGKSWAEMGKSRAENEKVCKSVKLMRVGPVCKMCQGAQQDFRGRQNPAPNRDAERPSAAQFLPPNGIIVPGAAHFPSFSHLCPKISQSCPDFCPDRDSCPDEISLKPATFFRLGGGVEQVGRCTQELIQGQILSALKIWSSSLPRFVDWP